MRIRLFIIFLIACLMITAPASATEMRGADVSADTSAECVELESDDNVIPTSSFCYQVPVTQEDTDEPRSVDPVTITVYENEYEKGTLVHYGSWRNGVSGGSNLDAQVIYLDHGYDNTLDISFPATVTGEYTLANGTTIGLELGVTLGASKNYSFGSGTTITVPKGCHWLIRYRPTYYVWKVTEKTYQEVYRSGYLLSRHLISTKISYVDVFEHWDYGAIDAPLPELMNHLSTLETPCTKSVPCSR